MSGSLEEVELQYVCNRISVGLALAVTPYVSASGVKLIRNQNIRPNRFDDSSIVYITPSFAASQLRKTVRENDVVVVRTGANIGDACVVPRAFDRAQSFTTLIIRADQKRLSPRYLAQFINSSRGRSEVRRLMAGGGKGNLNSGELERFRITLPPIDKQEQIATLLSEWDQSIEVAAKLITAKERQQLAWTRSLLTGQRRLKAFSGDWRLRRLGELFRERTETDRADLPLLSIGQDGVVPRDRVERKDTSSDNKSMYLRICPGDIGYNTMRMWQGVSALSDHEGIVSPAYTVCVPGADIDGRFASYLFKSAAVVHRFRSYSQGLTSDTWNLKFQHFAEIQVRIPEIREQRAIASLLSGHDQELELLKRQHEKFAEQKRGLMQKLLTGEWRLPLREEEVI